MFYSKEGIKIKDEILYNYSENDEIDNTGYIKDILETIFLALKEITCPQNEYWDNVERITRLDMEDILFEFYNYHIDDFRCGKDWCHSCRYHEFKEIIKEMMKEANIPFIDCFDKYTCWL